ncbi:MAG: amidohydrolase family protein, partial [Firmicutes bacterium]|nr:amidohydrolase family protein [Bacillota bacterium]
HFLFGTDYPITDQTEELKRFALLELNETEEKAILYENAAKLLGIEY